MIYQKRVDRIKDMLDKRQPTLELFLDDVSSSQNISAIIRSADCVGIYKIYYALKKSQNIKIHPTITQGSQNWVFKKRVEYNNRLDFIKNKKNDGYTIVSTSLDSNSISYRDYDYTKPTLIIMGNEKDGISKEVLDISDIKIKIPLMGMAQSLNVSVATSIILYEAQRQREEANLYSKCQLDNDEYKKLLDYFIFRDTITKKSRGRIKIDKSKLYLQW